MSSNTRLRRKLHLPEATDEGVTIMPFGFQINSTTTPDHLQGDELLTVARTAAGRFTCQARDTGVAIVFHGCADVSNTGNTDDFVGKVDWSTFTTTGTFIVRTMTAGTETDPADNVFVGGHLLVKKTGRRARARKQS